MKMKKLVNDKNKNLSEKYQINENIRLIKLMLPLIFCFIVINVIFNIIILYGKLAIINRDDLLLLNDTILFVSYNIFLIHLYFKFKKINDNKIEIINGNNKENEANQLNSDNQSNLKPNTVTGNIKLFNEDGKKIPTNYDQKAYFEMFAKSWNN
ncbi:7TM GPCR, serpentine receptor class e (Sre) family-containing protein [Strongyloides ratti]|uniref:7TM GPCR, serpentine receptor class e (Sre) family-containing protein n=1 Tax=Strongyloides ratti TaxID=34506 RepID=A0A090N0F7_STRRB|nr:7TM GPCR, serpentine receptor class e (Sre) family-containing protein [Strongyloides ratti]CEF70607.1 7TM GPCR, serpentine receptor class e (Sre) family-containing protein [Strongyloides ratti]